MPTCCFTGHFLRISLILQSDLAATKPGTLIAGCLGSLVFVFLLTALSNFQMAADGESVKAGLAEAIVCLLVALIVSASIHRVAISVCATVFIIIKQ
ncbi:unnamed protein product [Gongylonema pulchrum]|uniref:Uncharacterized protein n=1 Tax=Gongylonema pulchrum TaxID=637853 RepID=A0A3P7R269_9BILA|nr:unnamed protein product [Gongylonema pulchrum]